MEANLVRFGHRLALSWPTVGGVMFGLAAALGVVRRVHLYARVRVAENREDRRVRRELEAYSRLDVRVPEDVNGKVLGERVCREIVEVSAFRGAAMLLRNESGRLFVAGSAGVNDVTIEALNKWGERAVAEVKTGTKSFVLEPDVKNSEKKGGGRGWRVVPMWTVGGRVAGAVVVEGPGGGELGPIEGLAAKLARTVENAALAERRLQSEKLAGLGQLAGGVAHALNNPLTAVLGFAELIAETTEESRVRTDAETIVREAARMQETVQSLLDLWRPAVTIDMEVDLAEMARELAAECVGRLEERGVGLNLEIEEDIPPVRGSYDRLRQVMEHLLNNAAQAIAADMARDPSIKIIVAKDAHGVQVIVSDTGPGFKEPARVFDAFYTRQHAEQGAGLGLSICYWIVKEHGGEINAVNLHPRGAAVAVELPVKVGVEREVLMAG